MQGSSNVVVADNIINNITVYGNDQTVFYKRASLSCGTAAVNWA